MISSEKNWEPENELSVLFLDRRNISVLSKTVYWKFVFYLSWGGIWPSFLTTLDIFLIISHRHSVSGDFDRKYSFELLLFRLISSKEDFLTLLRELRFSFFFLLLLFLFFTQNLSLERVYIPNTSNCQSNFVYSCKQFSCSFFVPK